MKLRYRLTLGIGFLFALILLLGIQSVSYVRQLSKSSKEILADNYNSLWQNIINYLPIYQIL